MAIRRIFATLLIAGSLLTSSVFTSTPAIAQSIDTDEPDPQDLPACIVQGSVLLSQSSIEGTFLVSKVAGLIDPVVLSYLNSELDKAEEGNAGAFIIWMDSQGSVVDSDDLAEFTNRLDETDVPTGLWVGNSVGNAGRGNANALGGAGSLAAHVDRFALTPGSTFGQLGESIADPAVEATFGTETTFLSRNTYSAAEAEALGLSQGPLEIVADIKQFLASFENFETTDCLTEAGATVRQSVTGTQISGLSLTSQLFHTASSPEIALLFFAMGLGLLVFELYTAGIGVAGVLGAVSILLGSYGLFNLPTRPLAVLGLVVGTIAIAVDIQTNLPRIYTAVGVSLFSFSSIFLYSGLRASWVTIGVVIISTIIYAYSAMPAMVRSRFSTPTIGRRAMIGKVGVAVDDISPDGTVVVDGAKWTAVTNRATPINSGDNVIVASIDRLTLEVEPTEGAARDYRKR